MYNFIHLECWDGEPKNRPSMHRVVKRLKTIILQSDMSIYQPQNENFDNATANKNVILNNIKNLSHGKLSQLIQNFDKMGTKEIIESLTPSRQIIDKYSLFEKDLDTEVNDVVAFIFILWKKEKKRNLENSIFLIILIIII